jgi:hypothetical protein
MADMILQFPTRRFNTLQASEQELASARAEVQAWNVEIYHAWHRQDKDSVEYFKQRRNAAMERIQKATERAEMISQYKHR